MKKMKAIALVAFSAISLASCTCAACGGSGLQVRTSSGWVATPHGVQAGSGHETRTCVPCKGTGRVQWATEAKNILDVANGTFDTVNKAAGTFDHARR